MVRGAEGGGGLAAEPLAHKESFVCTERRPGRQPCATFDARASGRDTEGPRGEAEWGEGRGRSAGLAPTPPGGGCTRGGPGPPGRRAALGGPEPRRGPPSLPGPRVRAGERWRAEKLRKQRTGAHDKKAGQLKG